MLKTLEVVEQRSQLEVYVDIGRATTDVIRVVAADKHTGTIRLGAGLELVNHGRDLMIAAACAAVEPRPSYPTRRPDKVEVYLSSLELGQTEHGSYVVTILSRLPPPLLDQGEVLFDHPHVDEPFGRKVTRTLSKASSAVCKAAAESVATGSVKAFRDSFVDGVSTNLLDAFSGLHSASGGDRLGLGISWASARPTDGEPSLHVEFDRDAVEAIRDASRVLKLEDSGPEESFELRGVVTALRQDDKSKPGRVTVTGLVDGALRRVSLDLAGQSYDRAVEAHKSGSFVQFVGDLARRGRAYVLNDPRSFAVLPGETLEFGEPDTSSSSPGNL